MTRQNNMVLIHRKCQEEIQKEIHREYRAETCRSFEDCPNCQSRSLFKTISGYKACYHCNWKGNW